MPDFKWVNELHIKFHLNKKYRHNKTGDIYYATDHIQQEIINCTNENEGETMVIYTRGTQNNPGVFVREISEFNEKFTEVIDD
jgi:hypothetical protein